MADDTDTEVEALMEELTAANFSYERNGRVSGFAGMGGSDDGGGDGDDGGDHGAGGEPSGDDGAGDDAGADIDDGEAVGGDGGDNDRDHGAGAGAAAPTELPAVAQLSSEEQAALLNLRSILIAHPDLANEMGQRIRDKLSGKPAAAAGSGETGAIEDAGQKAELQLPEFIDPDDPQAVGLWKQQQDLQKRLDEAQRQAEAAQAAESTARVARDIAAGVERFRAQHPDLSDDDVSNIRNYTSANVNVPGVMANFPDDPAEGIARALEIGSLTDPSTRDKVLADPSAREAARKTEDQKRKQKLGALSGSTGSGARRAPAQKKPRDWNDVAKSIATELEALGGSS